eukprot:TRINITY_DN3999_c0_g2_i1.p1 TRINITY_DN3999_c0_g2~~TRINITY_DN3999_c0_g2_i1.p1  ORF type:complete len:424 (-),score=95.11 TRINITY_DN3999_c0_g2_i1:646-1917(-)
MGNTRSGSQTSSKDILEDSSWLRKVLNQYQKSHHLGVVSSFNEINIEKINGSDERRGFEAHRVSISFKNGSNKPRVANWIIKIIAKGDPEALIHSSLMTDIYKYLSCRSNLRVRYLLNVPEMILCEEIAQCKKALVLEDLTKTKSCRSIQDSEVACGLDLTEFKLFLGTLAQFHAVGFAWSTSFGDDSLLDSHPYLHRSSSMEDLSSLFDAYEGILKYAEEKQLFQDMARRKELFSLLRERSEELLNCDVLKDLSSPICGLCLGCPVPSEVLFRYEPSEGPPICAAVNSCHRIHYGNVIRELATSFFTLPVPLVREYYLTFMLQNYIQAFTLTSELLEVNTRKEINYSFEGFLLEFYEFVPHGMLRAIVMHMRRVSPLELRGLLSEGILSGNGESVPGSYFVPLSMERIHFLVALLNPLRKCA